ncbi:MAG TPA: GNAT family N-acetyltransferase [Acidimicrobiales bacterium]
MADVRRNDDVGRYEIWLDGGMVGLTQFRVRPDGVLVFPHTEVSEDHRGQGLAGQLIGGALDDVRGRGELMVAECPAVAGFIGDHPEYADLQADA